MAFPLGSLISGLGSMLAGGISTIGNLAGANKSFKMQQQLAAQQFDYNKQLMQMQMDYNNPANQLSMYRSAGVNPYAALGNNTSISATSVGQGSAPNMSNIGTVSQSRYFAYNNYNICHLLHNHLLQIYYTLQKHL